MAAPLGNQLIGLGMPAPLANAMTANVVQIVAAPATAASEGSVGQIATDGAFIYICISANTWERVAIASW